MQDTGTLELELVDVHGERIEDAVDIRLRHRVLSDEKRFTAVRADRVIRVENLHAEPQGLYTVEIRPKSYLPVSRFIAIQAGRPTRAAVTLPIDPDRVGRIEFPRFEALDARLTRVLERSSQVRSHPGVSGRALYDRLEPIGRAGLLNIAVKSLVTPFPGGGDLLDHITLLEIRGDRCLVQVPGRLAEAVERAVDDDVFRVVSGGLHGAPEGFGPAGSFKTLDSYGNLQLTFFQNAGGWVADVDIDDAAGLEHVFQVLRNALTKQPTHPYCIHQILVAHQRLDPGYRLHPASA
jgi:hypothetical protein